LAVSLFFSCSVSTGPSYPVGALFIPSSFPTTSVAGLPSACSGQAYYEASTSLCPPGLTYFLCDGNSYTSYDCSAPGEGWSVETLSEYDRFASDPAPCSGAGASGSGTVYVENSLAAPSENEILAFNYCGGSVPSVLVGRYPTGGSGAADLYNRGILDADQQVVVSADHTLLFAINQGSDTVAAFHIASDGSLTAVSGSPFPSGGTAPGSLGVRDNVLVVANKAVDGVRNLADKPASYVTFMIGGDGALTPTGSSYELSPGASPTQAFIAPGGNLMFGTEESGVLRALTLSSTGTLTLSPGSPMSLPDSLFPHGRPDPVWPAGLSASPSHEVLYTGVPNNSSIASFAYSATGELSLIGGYYDPDTPYPSLPCWSVVSGDGNRLYFADAGSDDVSVWDVEDNPSEPRLLQTFQLPGGGNPWGLHIDPSGQILFVIAPRQIHQDPLGDGQLLHALPIGLDGTLGDELAGAPVTLPVAPGTNVYGLAVVGEP
jgi:hypothetical protein